MARATRALCRTSVRGSIYLLRGHPRAQAKIGCCQDYGRHRRADHQLDQGEPCLCFHVALRFLFFALSNSLCFALASLALVLG